MRSHSKYENVVEAVYCEKESKKPMNKYLKTALVILYYLIFNIGFYVPFLLLNIDIDNIPAPLHDTYYISMEVIFIISLVAIYWKDLNKYAEDFKRNGKSYLKTGIKYWFIGLVVMIISNMLIGTLTPVEIPENEQAVRSALLSSPVIMIFATIIEAPILEEILFRKSLYDVFKNKKLFVIFSGVIFGAFHIIGVATSYYSWLYVIPYAALGIAFAYSYVKTKNLMTSICLHSFHNILTIIQLILISIWS